MSNSKTFPSVEPPPHPEANSKVSQPVAANSPLNVLEPDPASEISTITPTGPVSATSAKAPVTQEITNIGRKKSFPKPFLLIIAGIIVIILIFVGLLIFKNGANSSLVGTKGDITWWGIENEEDVIRPLIDEYQQKNPNVRINYIKQSTENYRERLSSALAGGQGPDIFEIHNSWTPMLKNELSAIPASVWSKDDFNKAFYPVVSKDLNTSAGIVGIPLEYDALTLYVNDSIFSLALKTPPKTWDDLNPLAKELTQKGQRSVILQAGVALGLTENVDHWPEILALMMLQNGAKLSNPGGKAVSDAVLYYLHFSREDNDWNSSLPESTTAFAKGKLAMYFAPTKRAAEIIKINPELKFRTVVLPQLAKENPNSPNVSYATYWAESVWKRSKNSELAWNFLKYMSSSESLQKLNQIRRDKSIMEKAYPKPDMAILQKDDKILGSIIELAPVSSSWYLADETFDGSSGINSQINKIFGDTLGLALKGGDLAGAVKTIPGKVNAVIAKFNSKKK